MLKRHRRRVAATLKIQTFYRMRFVKNSSFVKVLQIDQKPRIYFLKEQKPQFLRILRKLAVHLQKHNMTIEDSYNCIHEDNKYETIRVQEPDLFKFRALPLLQFIMPTFGPKTLIRENKNLGLDKVPLPELSLNQFFTTRDSDTSNHRLKTLQKRNCRFSH